jgi:pimeloyl-ACP methyl ester carboxylesterase
MPSLEGVRHHDVQLPGFRVHLTEAGSGPPLVLLHGFPQNWWEWRELIGPLAESHRVICPDMRGFGWSEAPAGGYEKEQLAEDVVALLDALELESVRLAGHDWGGMVGFIACLRNPERFSAYVAMNTIHPRLVVDGRLLMSMWRFWYQAVISAPGLGAMALSDPEARTVRLLCRWVSSGVDPWSEADAEVFFSQFKEPERARAGVQLYRGFLLRELEPILGGRYDAVRLRTPTLLLHGTADPVIRPLHLRGLSKHCDDLRVELVDGAGHFIADEEPGLVLARMLDFYANANADMDMETVEPIR